MSNSRERKASYPMMPWGWYPKIYFFSGLSSTVRISLTGKKSANHFHHRLVRIELDFFEPVRIEESKMYLPNASTVRWDQFEMQT